MKRIQDMTTDDLFEAESEYERRFGPCPVGVMDGGGPSEFLNSLKTSLLKNQPMSDPLASLPDGSIVY